MATEIQYAKSPEPFHWKLFIFVVLLMGSLTTAAIILTMMARPAPDTMHSPQLQSVAQPD
jgi:hypothetical protein